jgi:hypothetical protein
MAIAAVGVALLGPGVSARPAAALEGGCPNKEMRRGSSAALPDCRAYEMVTPVDHSGIPAWPPPPSAIADDGESLILRPGGALVPSEIGDLAGGFTHYVTTRTAEGWRTTAVDPPAVVYQSPLHGVGGIIFDQIAGESADARSTLWVTRTRSAPGPGPGPDDLYIEPTPGGPLSEIGPLLPPSVEVLEEEEQQERGAVNAFEYSEDLSHVAFEDTEHWPSDMTASGAESLYEYTGTENREPMLVGLDDQGELVSQCGTGLGSFRNSMSADGSIVYFLAQSQSAPIAGTPCRVVDPAAIAPPVDELYARIDNGQPSAHTVSVSEPAASACPPCDTEASVRANASFLGASEDGSRVYFETEQPLLAGAGAGENIYEYDLDAAAGENVALVSAAQSGAPEPPELQGLVQISQDGSHLYFVAKGVLTGANAEGREPHRGEDNLYVFDAETGETAFVGTLSEADREEWGEARAGRHTTEPLSGADTTLDGRFLVFTSVEDLTADDASASLPGTTFGQQLFEYDSNSGSLERISIGQNGRYNDDGNTIDTPTQGASIVSPVYSRAYRGGGHGRDAYWDQLSVSADGSYVFFESSDALTPLAAADPRNLVENVYEYHDGNIYLISDGRDVTLTGVGGHTNAAENENESEVKLLGTDPSGADVFFTTADPLVPQDTNGGSDIYDARVDGGFPAPQPAAQCEGDACQGQPSGEPALLSPGSEFQAGGGNLSGGIEMGVGLAAARKCRKGFVERHGRCVRKKKPSRAIIRSRAHRRDTRIRKSR